SRRLHTSFSRDWSTDVCSSYLGVELRHPPANPFQHHGGVLDLLVAIVGKYAGKFAVLAGIDALLVPVHGLQLLHERGDGAMQVATGVAQFADRLVVTLARHARLLRVICPQHAAAAKPAPSGAC